MKQLTPIPPSDQLNDIKSRHHDGKRHSVASSVEHFSREQVFEYLSMVARGIAQMLGSACETVVHDFTDPEHSIVALAGNVTGRQIGGAITDLGLSIMQSGLPYGRNILVYESVAPNGKRMKSTSVVFCDANGHPFGALCINLDAEAIESAAEFLTELIQISDGDKPIEEHYSDDPQDIISTLIQEELVARHKTTDTLKREERIEIVQALRDRGAFHMRNAPTLVAQLLGVSRYTIYNYLNHRRSHDGIESSS